MSVYVDQARNRFKRMNMCHMIADTLDELHAMAEAIGMKREWFQPLSFPHYDVAVGRRKVAIELGAIEIDRRGIAMKMRELRRTIVRCNDCATDYTPNRSDCPHCHTVRP